MLVSGLLFFLQFFWVWAWRSNIKMCSHLFSWIVGFLKSLQTRAFQLWAKYFISKCMKYKISVKVMAPPFPFHAYTHSLSSYFGGILTKFPKKTQTTKLRGYLNWVDDYYSLWSLLDCFCWTWVLGHKWTSSSVGLKWQVFSLTIVDWF